MPSRTSMFNLVPTDDWFGTKIIPFVVSPDDLSCFELENEATLNKLKRARCTRRKVAFRKRVEIYEIRSLQSLTQHEIDNTWYQPHELLEIRKSTETTLRLLKCGKPLDESEHCVRGLAARTKVGAKKRRQARLAVRSSVIEEQEQQRNGSTNPEKLAEICGIQSFASVQSALLQGRRDAEKAKEIYSEERYSL